MNSTVPQMAEIVILDRGKSLWTTSLDVSEKFGKRHDNVVRDIEKMECPPDFHRLNFEEISYPDSYGREQKAYELTRDGFTLLAMGFSGKRAMQWKIAYLSAFNAMERRILQLATERERRVSIEWQQTRTISRAQRRGLTDTIKEVLLPHMRSQGSTAGEDKVYMSYSRMIRSILFAGSDHLPMDYRDRLTVRQLSVLTVAESIADGIIQEEVSRGTSYKGTGGIFEKVKAKIIQYAATVGGLRLGEPERLSLAGQGGQYALAS